ncbi:MAG: MJ1255/VC2487 family glycosyltransferase [archaeon]
MAVIFYSLAGEGMGHAFRSETIINHLISQGHNIVIFSYERALEYLKKVYGKNKNVLDIQEIVGTNLIYEKNELNLRKTIRREYKKIPPFVFKNLAIFLNRIIKYTPNFMITDGEPFAQIICHYLEIPLICIDNQNLMIRCKLDKRFDKRMMKKVMEHIVQLNGTYIFITTVFDLPIKDKNKKNTYLVGPIVRDYFINAKPVEKDFILVYQTSKSNKKMFNILKKTDQKYIVYGFNKESKDKNLTFKKPSREGFAKNLTECKGVITNGGFTLISEAVTLKKPIYSIPIKKQIEQEINGYYIKKSGLGRCSEEINQIDLEFFLENLEFYKKNLSKVKFKPNDIFDLLDKKVNKLLASYKAPTRLKRIQQITQTYDLFIKRILEMSNLKKIKHVLFRSKDYLTRKKSFITNLRKLKIIKREKKEPQLLPGMKEKVFRISKKGRISYSVYETDFKAKKSINILFLHGLGGNKSVWYPVVEEMIRQTKKKLGFKVLMIDLVGHGKSSNLEKLEEYSYSNQSKLIKKIIYEAFGKKKPVIIGHCFGTFIAIKTGALINAEKVVLIASDPLQTHRNKINQKIVQNKATRKSLTALFKISRTRKKLNNYDYKRWKKSADINLARLFIDIKKTSLKGYFGSLYTMTFDSAHEDFLKLNEKGSVVLIHGKKDRIFPYKKLRKSLKGKKGRLITINRSNHLPVFNSIGPLSKLLVKEVAA